MDRGGDQGIGSFAELRERVQRGHVPLPPPWDKRPGTFEATRGSPARSLEPPAVAAAHEQDGWKVLLMSAALQWSLTPAQARMLADQLVAHAGLIEFGWDT